MSALGLDELANTKQDLEAARCELRIALRSSSKKALRRVVAFIQHLKITERTWERVVLPIFNKWSRERTSESFLTQEPLNAAQQLIYASVHGFLDYCVGFCDDQLTAVESATILEGLSAPADLRQVESYDSAKQWLTAQILKRKVFAYSYMANLEYVSAKFDAADAVFFRLAAIGCQLVTQNRSICAANETLKLAHARFSKVPSINCKFFSDLRKMHSKLITDDLPYKLGNYFGVFLDLLKVMDDTRRSAQCRSVALDSTWDIWKRLSKMEKKQAWQDGGRWLGLGELSSPDSGTCQQNSSPLQNLMALVWSLRLEITYAQFADAQTEAKVAMPESFQKTKDKCEQTLRESISTLEGGLEHADRIGLTESTQIGMACSASWLSAQLELLGGCHSAHSMRTLAMKVDKSLDLTRCQQLQQVICGRCGASEPVPGSFQKCGACKTVRYCGSDCQRQHWGAGHRDECKARSQRAP
ncbi:unnamed protein product [Polarella glacialis]|uniref:MYND-type domain-containing protein n=1 Tax=Polarella glacialis TaxID=89957 RepID=A0A813GQ56_POLGL|nr:unnamed protein product [Polarella glacialis]